MEDNDSRSGTATTGGVDETAEAILNVPRRKVALLHRMGLDELTDRERWDFSSELPYPLVGSLLVLGTCLCLSDLSCQYLIRALVTHRTRRWDGPQNYCQYPAVPPALPEPQDVGPSTSALSSCKQNYSASALKEEECLMMLRPYS